MKKKIFSFILAVLAVAAPLRESAFAVSLPFEIFSETYCVMDAKTGQVLIGGDEDRRMAPASITKILTCAMALEVLDPEAEYTFSKEAASYDYGSTHLAFAEGETCKIKDLLYGALVESANDCAMGLADAVSGSQLDFVRLMNEKLTELGCYNSHFANVSGMPAENHYTTAKDMAIITKYALSVEGFRTYFGAWEWTIPATNKNSERHFGTHHSMIVGKQGNAYFGYDRATGGKLGWTEEAKHTAVTVAEEDGSELICVVMKSTNKYEKYKDSINLFDYCFENFHRLEIPVSVRKTAVELTENGGIYGKMTVYPMAAVELMVTEDMTADNIKCTVNIPESCELSDINKVGILVSFDRESTAMETKDIYVSPEYYVVKESAVVEAEGEALTEENESKFRWWIFFAIPLGIIAFLALLVLIIRTINLSRRKKRNRHRYYNRLDKR